MTQLAEKMNERRDFALKMLNSAGVPVSDVEDVFQNMLIEAMQYYKDHMPDDSMVEKVLRLTANSQISKFFSNRGNTGLNDAETPVEDSGLTFDQAFSEQKKHAADPFTILSELDLEELNLVDHIQRFTRNKGSRELLDCIYGKHMSYKEAAEAQGVTYSSVTSLVKRFSKYLVGSVRKGE